MEKKESGKKPARQLLATLRAGFRGAFLFATRDKHEAGTQEQVARLEKVFKLMGKQAKGKNCPAIVAIIDEGKEIMDEYKTRQHSTPV